MSIESVMPSNHFILCHPLLLLSLIFPRIRESSQSTGASASASVLSMNIQDWFLLGLTGLISLQSKGLSEEPSPTPQFKSINSSGLSLLYGQVSHLYLTTGRTTALTTWTFVGKVMSAFSYTVKVCHGLILLRGLNSARVLHRMIVIVIIMPRAPSLVTGCHHGHVHPLDQRQEADDPICPTG